MKMTDKHLPVLRDAHLMSVRHTLLSSEEKMFIKLCENCRPDENKDKSMKHK